MAALPTDGKTPTTFHQLVFLPKELRDEIWKFAARDDRRGAHFFTLSSYRNPVFHSTNLDKGDCVINGFNSPHECVNTIGVPEHTLCPHPSHQPRMHNILSAPRPIVTQQCHNGQDESSWSTNNVSRYRYLHVRNRGLWGACHESRDIMQKGDLKMRREFSWFTEDENRHGLPDSEDPPVLAPEVAGYFKDRGNYHYFSIAKDDLICLQPVNLHLQPHRSSFHSVCGVPLFCTDFGLGRTRRLNLAIEFDVCHTKCSHFAGVGLSYFNFNALQVAGDIPPCTRNLWFIDYRISRKSGGNTDVHPDRQVFHGNGYRFVEVSLSERGIDDDCWMLPCGDKVDPELGYSYHFVWQLRVVMEANWIYINVGILACEKWDE